MFGFSGGNGVSINPLILVVTLALALKVAETEEATGSVTGFAPFQAAIISAGQPVVLNCTINGNVSPRQIRWKYNDRIFLSAAKNVGTCNYKLQWLSDEVIQLIIPVASPLDSGTYECGALVKNSSKKRRFWHRFGNRVLVHVIGEQLELTDTDCNAVGEKTVNVLWKPATMFKSTTQYSVYFCKDPWTRLSSSATPEKDYNFGCSIIVHQDESSKIKSHYKQCNLGEPLDLHFPSESFSYYIKANNSNIIYWSKKSECRLTMKFRCTKPLDLMVESAGSRMLTLWWSKPPFMGDSTHTLTYRIVYNAEGDLKNMTQNTVGDMRSASFRNLKPYTRYKFFIQCSIESSIPGAWGELVGPAENITWEEEPSEAPEFILSNPIEKKYGDLRNVTLAWKIPPKRTWNGVPSHFIIDFWKWRAESSNKTKPPSKQVVIYDGTATRGVICGLERFSDYRCTIRMCTKAGCGPSSGIKRVFPEISDKRSQPEASTKSSSPSLLLRRVIIIAVVIIVVAIIVVALVTAVCVISRRRNRFPDDMTVSSISINSSARANQENAEKYNGYEEIQTSDLPTESTDPEQQLSADEQVRFAPEDILCYNK